MMKERVWFVTGCSSGFGAALARAVLERGERAVVTARDPATLQEIAARHPQRCLALRLDVTVRSEIDAAVAAAQARFGSIDVLVNNAGQGFVASVEDASEADVRALFELNVFGVVNLTRAVLPGMRSRRRGHIVNISSISGLLGRAGSGYYAATKFAVEGLSEALAKEVQEFGLHVTIVEPAGFRTRFRQAQHVGAAGVYDQSVGARLKGMATLPPPAGDPDRAALGIIAAVDSPTPPLRLPLGAEAVDTFRRKIEMLQQDLRDWQQVAVEADAPESRSS